MNDNERRAEAARIQREQAAAAADKRRLQAEEEQRRRQEADRREREKQEAYNRQVQEREKAQARALEEERKKTRAAQERQMKTQQAQAAKDAAPAEQRRKQKNQKVAQKKDGCFVATAAFGDYNAPEVAYLSAFRDESLSRSVLGRGFIRAYYAISPRLAMVIAKSGLLRSVVRKGFLQPAIFLLRQLRD